MPFVGPNGKSLPLWFKLALLLPINLMTIVFGIVVYPRFRRSDD